MPSRATNTGANRRGKVRGARHACAGFTIVELVITFFIMMTIAAIAVPHLQAAIGAAKIARTVADIRTIGNAALEYYAETGAAPSSLAVIGYDQNADGWGQPYQYLPFTADTPTTQMRTDSFGVPVNTFFDLYSLGADGQTAPSLTAPQSQDDVIWANDGTFIDLASNY